MSLSIEQIEPSSKWTKKKASKQKWMKNQRNRKIRRTDQDDKPNIKYKGWEL